VSSLFSELGGITGGVGAEGLAFAAGFAAARALEPAGVTIAQDSWNVAPVRRLQAELAARVAAEGLGAKDDMASEATYSGYDASRFDALYGISLTAPGRGELLTMLRRKTINAGNFTHGLRKASVEPMWDDALAELRTERIPVADLAYMVVRGLVPDAGLLPVPPPATTEKVLRYPIAQLDTLAEAADWGWDEERFRALVGRSGLSMAPVMAANAHFRDIIGLNDYYLAIAEGDLRNEWRDAILEASRAIPSPHEFEEAALRGIVTRQTADAGAALHGMTAEHAALIFDIIGRPLPVHGITTGLARGGKFGGTYTDVPEPYQDAIRRSNIRPEYAVLAHANRYTYPSAFVIRALITDGVFDEAQAEEIFLELGWRPDLAKRVAVHYAGTTKAKGDAHVTKAETQVWTALHKSYVDNLSTDAEAQADLATLGVAEPSIPAVLSLWQTERAIIRRSLTPVQIKKAIGQPGKDHAWAHARLVALGESSEDADTFLAE
jgi:hypothetical protein